LKGKGENQGKEKKKIALGGTGCRARGEGKTGETGLTRPERPWRKNGASDQEGPGTVRAKGGETAPGCENWGKERGPGFHWKKVGLRCFLGGKGGPAGWEIVLPGKKTFPMYLGQRGVLLYHLGEKYDFLRWKKTPRGKRGRPLLLKSTFFPVGKGEKKGKGK